MLLDLVRIDTPTVPRAPTVRRGNTHGGVVYGNGRCVVVKLDQLHAVLLAPPLVRLGRGHMVDLHELVQLVRRKKRWQNISVLPTHAKLGSRQSRRLP